MSVKDIIWGVEFFGGTEEGALFLDTEIGKMQQELPNKHYLSKHGENAYYGQVGK